MRAKLNYLMKIRRRSGKTPPCLFAVIGLMLITITSRPVLAQELAVKGDLDEDHPGQVEKRSLENYLVELENQYKVAFNYNSELVQNKYVFVNPNDEELDNSLKNALEPLNLKSKKIGDNLYVIKKAKKNQIINKLEPKGPSEEKEKAETSFNNRNNQNLLAAAGFNTLSTRIPSSQDITVSGTVTSQEGEALPGVNVVIQGSPGSGTVTNANGGYSLSAPENGTLVFSFVGYVTEQVQINGRSTINVTMVQDIGELQEVVVTAFGMEREQKSLTYSTQTVDNTDIQKARELNITNSLKGKVAGIDIKTAASGVGGGTRVTLRGNRSLSGGNQPLYIVDGMPIRGDIGDLSPDNIASINVLKGANAAALYGQRAQNGAIIITTKGGQFEEKETTLSLNQTYMRNSPNILKEFQNQYGQGLGGTYGPKIEQNWGPPLDGREVQHWSPDQNWPVDNYSYEAHPNNVRDVYQVGHNSATSIAVDQSNETSSTRFSYTFTDAEGVVPGNKLSRHNIFVRSASKLLNNLTVDAKIQYIREQIDNSLSTGESFANPNRHAYRLPRNISTADASQESYINESGQLKQNFWNPGSNGGANPYWTLRRNLNENTSDELISYASMTYNFTDALSLQARSSIDVSRWNGKSWMYNDTYIIAQDGNFAVNQGTGLEWNSNFLATYQEDLNDNWYVSVNLGGNLRKERYNSLNASTEPGLTVRNFFALSNAEQPLASHNPGAPKDVQSLFGSAEIGFQNAIFLDITGRNDWSSSLPPGAWSFFYPSAGLNVVLSDLMDFPDFFSFLKIRGNYAEVGNDAPPQRTTQTANFTSGGANGYLELSSTKPAVDLKPEKTQSTELGADMRFFEGNLRLDATWYKSNSFNQLFSIQLPVGSGYSQIFTNGGNVQNKGWELIANATAFDTDNFSWNISANWNTNDNKVIEINDDRPRVSRGGSFLHTFILEQGKPWGIIESKGFVRDEQGRVIVGDDGIPRYSDAPNVPIANFQPDWMAGITNRFTFGNFNASFLIDIREGGTIASLTNAILYNDGLTKATLQGREGGLVFGENFFPDEEAVKADGSPNDIKMNAEEFWRSAGGRNDPKGEAFVKSASNIRMREVTLGYTLPSSIIDGTPFRNISINFVGRNLFFIQRDANYDPEVVRSPAEGNVGFNSFTPPISRNYGFNLSVDF